MLWLKPINISDALKKLDPDGPLVELYNRASKLEGHTTDTDIWDQIKLLRDQIETQFPNSRCSEMELWKRVGAVESIAIDLFKKFEFVEGIIFQGSALRGKANPKDIDIIVLTSAQDPELKNLNQYPYDRYVQTKVHQLEEYCKTTYPEVNRTRCSIAVEFSKVRWACSIDNILEGPFLAIVRVGSSRKVLFGNVTTSNYTMAREP